MRRLLAVALALALIPLAVRADPTSALPAAATPLGAEVIIPCAQGAPLVSKKCKATDIASVATASSLQRLSNLSDLSNAATARINLGLGSAATQAVGTSGATVPLLNGANTWAGTQVEGNPANSTDGTITTSTATHQCIREAAASILGTGAETCTFDSADVPLGHGNGFAYDVAAHYARCRTSDPNTGALIAYDCTGLEGQAIALSGLLDRLFGTHGYCTFLIGTDGYCVPMEAEIYGPGGTAQPALDTATTKMNYHAVCGMTVDCTAVGTDSELSTGKYYSGWLFHAGGFETTACVFGVTTTTGNGGAIGCMYQWGGLLGTTSVSVQGAAGTTRLFQVYTGATASADSLRWQFGADATAESGTNAGSDVELNAFSDAGSLIGTYLKVTRSSGLVTLSHTLSVLGAESVSGGYIADTFNAAATYPTAANGSALGWNFTNGGGEVDAVNTYTGGAGADGFNFYQQTGASAMTLLASISKTGLITEGNGVLMASSVALTDGSGASSATLTNAPAAGNPTKWIEINDNGTIRKIPAW